VACALGVPRFLASRRYAIKQYLPFNLVMAGWYSCVVRNVTYDATTRAADDALPSMLPSSVRSLFVYHHADWNWRMRDLPRSLTYFGYSGYTHDATIKLADPEEWPPSLTSLDYFGFRELPLPPLPPHLLSLRCCGRASFGDLPRSLTTLQAYALHGPLSQLPPHLTSLRLVSDDAEAAQWKLQDLNELPQSLTHLVVYAKHRYTTQDRSTVRLPPSLRSLDLPSSWFPALHSLPPQLEHLRLEIETEYMDIPIVHLANLLTLELPYNVSMPIRSANLPNLRSLTVDEHFDHPLDDLPPSLVELSILGQGLYNHDLDHLPSSLSKLTVERDFQQPLDHLPSSLHLLSLGTGFNHPLNQLPASLTVLDLYHADQFNQPLDHLPQQLQVLKVGERFCQSLDALPSSLTHLEVFFLAEFDQPLDYLPDSLRVLILGAGFNQPLDYLPSSLTALQLQYCRAFNQPLYLPDSLTSLWLDHVFNQPFECLPSHLTELKLGGAFNHPLPLVAPKPPPLPPSLQSTSIAASPSSPPSSSTCTNETESKVAEGHGGVSLPLSSSYPMDLRSLYLGQAFNQPLLLPPSLTKLEFHAEGAFEQPLSLSSLPTHLISLKLPTRYRSLYPEYDDVKRLRQQCPFVRFP